MLKKIKHTTINFFLRFFLKKKKSILFHFYIWVERCFFCTDRKAIVALCFFFVFCAGIIGLLLSIIIRVELNFLLSQFYLCKFFQDPDLNFMEKIINLHHEIMFYLIILSVLVFWFLVKVNFFFINTSNIRIKEPSKVINNTTLEIVWTIIPCILLILIAIPSLSLIYSFQPVFLETDFVIITGEKKTLLKNAFKGSMYRHVPTSGLPKNFKILNLTESTSLPESFISNKGLKIIKHGFFGHFSVANGYVIESVGKNVYKPWIIVNLNTTNPPSTNIGLKQTCERVYENENSFQCENSFIISLDDFEFSELESSRHISRTADAFFLSHLNYTEKKNWVGILRNFQFNHNALLIERNND